MSTGKLAAIIGWPVHQSLSPMIHSYWLKKYGIAGTYVALPIAPENFERCISALPLMGFAGVNVTVPHKEAAFTLSSTHDPDALITEAVNTLIFKQDAIMGLNTDAIGFEASIRDSLGENVIKGGTVAILGAGGAARAVSLALVRLGACEIRIANRTRARAEALAKTLAARASVKLVEWGDWQRAFTNVSLLVNSTSLGMTGKPPLELSLTELPTEAAVADIVYNPLETKLLQSARRRGHRTMDGLGMLMHQAAPAFAAWFGIVPAVTDELRSELTKALARA